MKTSEVRKLAFKLAVQMYEDASGHLKFTMFTPQEEAAKIGISDPTTVDEIVAYLTSVDVMEHQGIGSDEIVFTALGMSVIEASFDDPQQSHGPFPPMSIVIGDVGAGAQLAIGHGTYHQEQRNGAAEGALDELLAEVRRAIAQWDGTQQRQVAGAVAAIEGEAANPSPDVGLVRASANKIAKVAETIGTSVATQALAAYLKLKGWIPA